MQTNKIGGGLLNGSINLLPFEVHLPGYQFCGPGTEVEKRLARGDIGINALDKSCRKHDIVYHNIKNGAALLLIKSWLLRLGIVYLRKILALERKRLH